MSLRDQAPAVEQSDGVREVLRLFQVLGGEEDRHAVGEQLADDLPQVAAASRVQSAGRLVEEDQPRAAHQRHGQVEPALHAAGVRRGAPVRGLGQPERGQQLVDAGAGVASGQVREVRHQPEVLPTGQQPVDRRELAGHTDGPAYAVGLGR